MASRELWKTYFFPIWRPVRGESLIFVCFYGCIVCPAGAWTSAWRRPLPPFSLYKPVFNGNTTHPLKHTKIKLSPLTGLQMEKKYVFHNPKDAIQNFWYGLKKNFLITLRSQEFIRSITPLTSTRGVYELRMCWSVDVSRVDRSKV